VCGQLQCKSDNDLYISEYHVYVNDDCVYISQYSVYASDCSVYFGYDTVYVTDDAVYVNEYSVYIIDDNVYISEYGETWHKAGMLSNKQRVFNDFQSAAEYLIEHKYTDSSKYAVITVLPTHISLFFIHC